MTWPPTPVSPLLSLSLHLVPGVSCILGGACPCYLWAVPVELHSLLILVTCLQGTQSKTMENGRHARKHGTELQKQVARVQTSP